MPLLFGLIETTSNAGAFAIAPACPNAAVPAKTIDPTTGSKSNLRFRVMFSVMMRLLSQRNFQQQYT
jgi:hypothetical protein